MNTAKTPQDRKKKTAAKRSQTPGRVTPAKPRAATSASQWRDSKGNGVELVVPSGNICLVNPVGMANLVKTNRIPNSLMGVVNEAILSGEQKPPTVEDMQEVAADLSMVVDVMEFIDLICVECVASPPLSAVPQRETTEVDDDGEPIFVDVPMREREALPDGLYVDEVDLDDRVFIWQYAVGGTRDLETFRQGLAGYMGAVPEE